MTRAWPGTGFEWPRDRAPAPGGRDFIAPAQAAEVVSSNIVGYNKLAVTANAFEILGAQFTSIGDTDIDIQDLIVDGVAAGDNLLFFNGTGYDSYTYSDETYSEDWSQQLGPGWLDDEVGTRSSREVDIGKGFWIKAASAEIEIGLSAD